MGSASEDEDDDDPPHLRGSSLGLGVLGPNGPDSAGGPLGASDISVQSMSTDSKNTHDDSDQVNGKYIYTHMHHFSIHDDLVFPKEIFGDLIN